MSDSQQIQDEEIFSRWVYVPRFMSENGVLNSRFIILREPLRESGISGQLYNRLERQQVIKDGTLMVSGGGSGAMEATSLGGLMAGRSVEELDDALSILAKATSFADKDYLSVSFHVLEKYPQKNKYECLSIPTWLHLKCTVEHHVWNRFYRK